MVWCECKICFWQIDITKIFYKIDASHGASFYIKTTTDLLESFFHLYKATPVNVK
jgi:hypothetical protein